MTIQQCLYILKIAELGSFNEAAKRLFIAQSSLSVSVKSLEKELGIKIFERSGNGVYLTDEGVEFARYARQLVEQNDFIINRFSGDNTYKRLYVCTQHYDFVADVFANLLNEINDEGYQFALREMKTYDVICETETAYCDIGIIAIKGNDLSVMKRYIEKRGLIFTELKKARPHIFVRKEHPLSRNASIIEEQLKIYPYISYEQGEHGVSFFSEEILHKSSEKRIEISDRATLMNILLATNGYTIGTGIMPSLLNEERIVSIPFESDDCYLIGYILRKDRVMSPLAKKFTEMLKSMML